METAADPAKKTGKVDDPIYDQIAIKERERLCPVRKGAVSARRMRVPSFAAADS
jgi:hypothetical protein